MPELKVINDGLLKGYVIINPRWGAFSDADYIRASASAYEDNNLPTIPSEVQIEVQEGDFDLRGFELARLDFFDVSKSPYVTFSDNKMKFSAECFKRMSSDCLVELLIHPLLRKFAVRPTTPENRSSVRWCTKSGKSMCSHTIPCTAFFDVLYSLFAWNKLKKYRIYGSCIKDTSGSVCRDYADRLQCKV